MADVVARKDTLVNGTTRADNLPTRYKDVVGDGSEYAPTVYLGGSAVTITAGLGDGTAFVEGTTAGAPVGGMYDEDATDAVDERFAVARITAKRAIHFNPRDNSGNEIFVAAKPGIVSRQEIASVVNLNVATGQAPLNTIATILASQADTGVQRRALAYNYTGDKALTLTLQLQLGATLGLVSVLTLSILAGNSTPQKGIVFANPGAAALGTVTITGTAPTIGLAGSWDVLDVPATNLAIQAAVAAGPTTVGVLQLDLIEQR